ncbi:hypothetical protein LF599_12095 [Pseudodesulfovibrio thermohalotolerans]|uniref:hypothetical protein n=1 Tax=Pseudodesulfovibrio thermohalotolerans TaxID=2880651 RepID=UPI0022B9DEB6|nr:hypothetical protein [Pseudodesulfovibrio thermohalotolerans]WFS61406.1 hypothetical protein LF599_12095 [Pseudodesulfovibrio thermohalotolerans]
MEKRAGMDKKRFVNTNGKKDKRLGLKETIDSIRTRSCPRGWKRTVCSSSGLFS